MNTGPQIPPPMPGQAAIAPNDHRWALSPIEGPISFGTIIDHLLKKPGRLMHEFMNEKKGISWVLVVCALVAMAVFGLLLGTFSGGVQMWAAPLKLTVGMFFASLICLPSLYIFCALSGMSGKLSYMISTLYASLALCGLLLLGFAPVLWVFAQSTESLPFMGFLALAFWFISLGFGLQMMQAAAALRGVQSPGYINVWMTIFFVVVMQMSTSLRPIIGQADTLLPTEKRFFVEHWFTEMNAEAPKAKKAAPKESEITIEHRH